MADVFRPIREPIKVFFFGISNRTEATRDFEFWFFKGNDLCCHGFLWLIYVAEAIGLEPMMGFPLRLWRPLQSPLCEAPVVLLL